jgi:DNA-binding transcriptional ArsR family regulator
MTIYASRRAADAAAERLKVYAQPQRLMILSRLLDGEYTVSEIDEATGIGQPALSQQLAELRRADVVKTRREAKQVYYRLADESVQICVRGLEAMFGDKPLKSNVLDEVLGRQVKALVITRQTGAAGFARIA